MGWYITDITWDATEAEIADNELPTKVDIPDNEDIQEDDISDYLSDEYGFCVVGYCVETKQN